MKTGCLPDQLALLMSRYRSSRSCVLARVLLTCFCGQVLATDFSPLERIASLVLSSSNTTSSDIATFVLNASNSTRTRVFLVPFNFSSTLVAEDSDESLLQVFVKILVFTPSSAETVSNICHNDLPLLLSDMVCISLGPLLCDVRPESLFASSPHCRSLS